MATLSTLELMLHEIQKQENLEPYGDHERMPVLPQRPVSKARPLPGRARRTILSIHFQELGGFDGKKEGFVDGKRKRDHGFAFVEVESCCRPNDGGLVLSKNKMKNDAEEKAEKGIIGIQKCFRGYQARFHYHKLKERIITLQSFIRGENARREFQNSIKRLTYVPSRTHINQEFVWEPLKDRETTIIYLQSVVRGWLSRRRLGYHGNTKSATIDNTNEANCLHNENIESEEHVTVSKSYIRDLQRQVLRIEAALRHKKHENSILESQIQQIDKNWEVHKAEMDTKEKIWQDEFTSIQMSLASARERMTKEITHLPQTPTRRQENGRTNLTIRQILELQESDMHGDGVSKMVNSRIWEEHELRKLKGRFKAWKKDFKARLHEIKRTLDRFDHSKVHKSCWVG